MAFYVFYPPTNLVTAVISGPVTVNQGTSPWIVGGTVAATQSGTWNIGTVTSITDPVTVNQGTNPWTVDGTVNAVQSGTWTTGRTWILNSGTDSVSAVQSGTWNIGTVSSITNPVTVNQGTSPWVISGSTTVSGTVTANQGTSPWVVSGTVTSNIGTTGGLALDTTVAATHGSATGGIAATQSDLSGGIYNTAPPTLTNGQQASLQLDVNGNLKTSGTAVISGPVTVNQGTSPWVVSGTVAATQSGVWSTGRTWTLASGTDSVSAVQSGTWDIGTVTTITNPVAVTQSTSPWVVSGTVAATQSGTWNIGTLSTITNPVTVNQGTSPWIISGSTTVSGTVTANQGTSPWVVSGTVSASNFPATVDTNYGTVGASTLRTAAQIGNATGVAAFNAGTTTAQVLRVVLPTDQTAIPVTQSTSPWVISGTVAATQSGAWTTGRTWTLSSGTDSVSAVQSGTWNIGTVTTITNPVAVTQSTSPWVVSGTVTANIGTTGGLALDASLLQIQGTVAAGAAATHSVLTGGVFNTTPPTLTNGQQAALQLDSSGNLKTTATVTIPGTVSVTQGTSPWVVSGTVAATQSGTWNITNISGTISLPTGAATSALQTTGNASLASIDTKLTAPLSTKEFGFASMAYTNPSVTSSSSTILASNANRRYVMIYNQSGSTVFVFPGSTALVNQGIRLTNNSSYEITGDSLFTGAIQCIKVGAAAALLDVFEGS